MPETETIQATEVAPAEPIKETTSAPVEADPNANIVPGPPQCLSFVKGLTDKLLKKVQKEGGKRGVEIEGAADMGGLQFFCTNMGAEITGGDVHLLLESMKSMNAISDPSEEERKGGAGKIGKMIFSCVDEKFAAVAYVPKDKSGECSAEEWLKEVILQTSPDGMGKKLSKTVTTFELDGVPKENYACVQINVDGEAGVFPLKFRDPAISVAYAFLRKKGLFPEDDSDSEDEMVFGDDDFPDYE